MSFCRLFDAQVFVWMLGRNEPLIYGSGGRIYHLAYHCADENRCCSSNVLFVMRTYHLTEHSLCSTVLNHYSPIILSSPATPVPQKLAPAAPAKKSMPSPMIALPPAAHLPLPVYPRAPGAKHWPVVRFVVDANILRHFVVPSSAATSSPSAVFLYDKLGDGRLEFRPNVLKNTVEDEVRSRWCFPSRELRTHP